MAARSRLVLSAVVVLMAGTLQTRGNDSDVVREPRVTGAIDQSAALPPTVDEDRAAYSRRPTSQARAGPVIAGSMPKTVARKLRGAYEVAVERVRGAPQCRDLFTRLGVDGVRMLESTLYIPAHPLNEESVCRSRATIFTKVGAAQTWVCRRFSALSNDRAAMSLLHEALHHGGLAEYPQDPQGLRAREIDGMVARACGF